MLRLLKLREEKGITQEQAAKMLCVSRQAYSRYERGERELGYNALSMLAEFFDVSIDYLLGRSELYYPDKMKNGFSELTEDEIKFVTDLRKLTPGMRDILRTTLNAMINDSKVEV